MKWAYATKCFELAKFFLTGEASIDTMENVEELAQLIQDTIEDFIAGKKEG